VRVAERGWTFLTNHAHVLVAIARDPEARLRDVAAEVGITERAAQGIVHDLVAAGYVTRERVGRRNRYEVNAALPLRHPLEREHDVAVLLAPLGRARRPRRSTNPVSTRL
jgi:DNA-binding IclR family transcriptional regulator